ncbi:MAG: HD domain-containing protein [Lachnospiraceae bacterium]|nr:HD domain-containing protein [Lachnospiraceae bacterium]
MKTITKMELTPGMILAEDIIDQGRTLYSAGTKVDSLLIEKLNRYSILCVTIMEDIDFASTHYERMRYNENFKSFEKAYVFFLNSYKTEMMQFLSTGVRPADSFLLNIYNELYTYISSGSVLLDYLYNMVPNEDELTFTQCLNSALLAGAFADWLNMNKENKETLILCGFYYDIGKLQLPYDLLWKPDKLTKEEYEIVKKHPVVGYAMIRNQDLNEHVKNAVIMHHERLDGSGYPYHMTGAKIDVFARYIAIVDAYIAMASPRAYRNAFTPLQILGNFEQSLDKFDVELLMPLMKRIADAQIGSHVQLNDDSIWEVLIIHTNKFSRPSLKNENNELIDLREHPELEIVKIC